MADKRINALANTAPSTASDDFIAVDGTTNGTRKLNAFSPTFGGNATVTGTLTVNGATASTIAGGVNVTLQVGNTSAEQRAVIGCTRRLNYGDVLFGRNLQGKSASDNYTAVATSAGTGFGGFEVQDGGVARVLVGTGATTAGADVTPTVALSASTSAVSIPLTTASTTTSTGALVVGNGTSGGLGVGGNIYAGGNVVSTAAGGKFLIFGTGNTTESKELTFKRSDDADNFTLGLTGSAYAGSLTGLGNNEAFLYNSNASAFRIFIGTLATNRFDFTQSQFKINATTASTTTSSGALVVSGGVGVAGNTNIGGVASVGGSSSAAVGVYVINTALTGTDQYGVASEPIWTSAANLGHTLWARTKTAASAFTLTAGHGVFVEIPTLGAGSAITNNYGVRINNQGTTGVTNAYGLYVASQSGASTLNYAIYTAGGRINFQGLPTSSAGLPAGTLWNDSGTLKVA